MTHRSKLLPRIFAVFVAVASCAAYAQTQDSSATDTGAANATPAQISPNASSTVTTTGGTANKVAKFSSSNTIVNSILYDNGTDVGIGTTSPTATLTVDGTMTVNGISTLNGPLILPPTGSATSSKSSNSQYLKFDTAAYNSSSKSTVFPRFQLQGEVTGNDTASPKGTLNLLTSATATAPVETGLYINSNGTIHFAPGQTFPGGSPFCVATANGFGSGGTTFVGPEFAPPAGGKCTQWSGFTKTASTVVLMTSGVACLSSDGKKLTLSVSSADPDFLGAGNSASDFIQLTRTSTTGSFSSGSDMGEFAGSAQQITCSSSLLQLNENND